MWLILEHTPTMLVPPRPCGPTESSARDSAPASLGSLGAFVLGGVFRGEWAIGHGDRDDPGLGYPVVRQIDDVPLPVVLVFDDQGDGGHAVIVTGSKIRETPAVIVA
jgi:hypothetical protein